MKKRVYIDSLTLMLSIAKAIKKGKTKKELADDLGVTVQTVGGKRVKDLVDDFKKGIYGDGFRVAAEDGDFDWPDMRGKKDTSLHNFDEAFTKFQLEMADILDTTPENVVENGQSLVRKEDHPELAAAN